MNSHVRMVIDIFHKNHHGICISVTEDLCKFMVEKYWSLKEYQEYQDQLDSKGACRASNCRREKQCAALNKIILCAKKDFSKKIESQGSTSSLSSASPPSLSSDSPKEILRPVPVRVLSTVDVVLSGRS